MTDARERRKLSETVKSEEKQSENINGEGSHEAQASQKNKNTPEMRV